MKSFFGYPGGKSRLAKRLLDRIGPVKSYAEPFAGGFSVGLTLLDQSPLPVWINDLDRDVICLWKATIYHTDALCDQINRAHITVDTFYRIRDRILSGKTRPLLDTAIDKLLVHKLSYSNMGEMAASPVGGKNQTGDLNHGTG